MLSCEQRIKNTENRVLGIFGLPERIRTVDLQSRSLTRYPAVPRADVCLNIISQKSAIFNHILTIIKKMDKR